MGWRFRKSISLGRFFRINLSKKGVGASVGVPGFRIGVGADGKVRRTVSIPGTGLYKTEVLSKGASTSRACPECGKRVGAKDSYCRCCGARLE